MKFPMNMPPFSDQERKSMQIIEIIRSNLGWCPNGYEQGTWRHIDSLKMNDPVTPEQQGPSDDGIPPVIETERYRNRQISIFYTAVMIVAIICGIFDYLMYQRFFPGIFCSILIVIVWLMSASLTVTIYDNLLEIRLGPLGLNNRKIHFTEIESVNVEKNPKKKAIWYFIPRADPRIRTGVAIELRNGKRIWITTDDPEVLRQAVEDFLARTANVRSGGVPG
jgi:hypothetical protein